MRPHQSWLCADCWADAEDAPQGDTWDSDDTSGVVEAPGFQGMVRINGRQRFSPRYGTREEAEAWVEGYLEARKQ